MGTGSHSADVAQIALQVRVASGLVSFFSEHTVKQISSVWLLQLITFQGAQCNVKCEIWTNPPPHLGPPLPPFIGS